VVYSLAPPGLTGKTVPRHERQGKTLGKLGLDEYRGALITLVGVLFVDGGMVFLRVVTALKNDTKEMSKLSQCVSRVVHVGL
jgi:hypothetical protein